MVHTDGDWHEMKVGVVAPLGPDTGTDPDSGRVSQTLGEQSVCAGLETAAAFWWRLYCEARRRGLGAVPVTLIVVLGDGADWIWHAAARFLALRDVELVEIVDIYHAWEHLWTVANAVFGTGSAAAAAWVAPLKRRLEHDGVAPVLAALTALEPPGADAAEEVRKAQQYFTDHATRMDYPRFVARQLPIGSGVIESANKTLITAREKGAGMRWSRAGAQAVASLRAVQRSGRWDAFWRTQPQRRRPAPLGLGAPEGVPAPGALHRPQTGHRLRPRATPAHPGPFLPRRDQRLVRTLDHPGANRELAGYKARVVHPRRVVGEVLLRFADLLRGVRAGRL